MDLLWLSSEAAGMGRVHSVHVTMFPSVTFVFHIAISEVSKSWLYSNQRDILILQPLPLGLHKYSLFSLSPSFLLDYIKKCCGQPLQTGE